MKTAITFVDFIAPEIASSRCFKVEADDGRHWVVRVLWDTHWSKRLFNQYIAGVLGQEYGLCTPEVTLINLQRILPDLKTRGLAVASTVGVATRYLDGISNILHPNHPYDSMAPDLSSVNREHLIAIFGEQYAFDQFYAYQVFGRWLQMEDDHKWANLYLLPNLIPVFIDFDLALGGTSWDSLPGDYYWGNMLFKAPFCEGVLTDEGRYEPWFQRLQGFDEREITKRIRMIPDEWGIQQTDLDYILNQLLVERGTFVEQFKASLEVQSEMSS